MDEAKAFLSDKELRKHLVGISVILLDLDTNNPEEIFSHLSYISIKKSFYKNTILVDYNIYSIFIYLLHLSKFLLHRYYLKFYEYNF